MAGENPNDQAAQLLNETTQKLQESQQANAALVAENETLKAVNDELTAKVEELSNKKKNAGELLAEAQEQTAPVIPAESFEVEGKAYVFIAPVFQHAGARITAEAALKDEALLAHLVKIGSGLIQAK